MKDREEYFQLFKYFSVNRLDINDHLDIFRNIIENTYTYLTMTFDRIENNSAIYKNNRNI